MQSIGDHFKLAEIAEHLNSTRAVDELTYAQCKMYLRANGLLHKGTKNDFVQRIENHYNQVRRGSSIREQEEHPRSSFTEKCRGGLSIHDHILFKEKLKVGSATETRWIAASVAAVSEKCNRYILEVLWSDGANLLACGSEYILYAKRLEGELEVRRQKWGNEKERNPQKPKSSKRKAASPAATKTDGASPAKKRKHSPELKKSLAEGGDAKKRKHSPEVKNTPAEGEAKKRKHSKLPSLEVKNSPAEGEAKKRKLATLPSLEVKTGPSKRVSKSSAKSAVMQLSYPPGDTSTDDGLRNFHFKRIQAWSIRGPHEPCIEKESPQAKQVQPGDRKETSTISGGGRSALAKAKETPNKTQARQVQPGDIKEKQMATRSNSQTDIGSKGGSEDKTRNCDSGAAVKPPAAKSPSQKSSSRNSRRRERPPVDEVQCHICQQVGHLKKNCPTRPDEQRQGELNRKPWQNNRNVAKQQQGPNEHSRKQRRKRKEKEPKRQGSRVIISP